MTAVQAVSGLEKKKKTPNFSTAVRETMDAKPWMMYGQGERRCEERKEAHSIS